MPKRKACRKSKVVKRLVKKSGCKAKEDKGVKEKNVCEEVKSIKVKQRKIMAEAELSDSTTTASSVSIVDANTSSDLSLRDFQSDSQSDVEVEDPAKGVSFANLLEIAMVNKPVEEQSNEEDMGRVLIDDDAINKYVAMYYTNLKDTNDPRVGVRSYVV